MLQGIDCVSIFKVLMCCQSFAFHLCDFCIFLSLFFQGTLIQHLKEHILHGNMTSSDVIMYYTTASGA